jgi:hypothetical protein
MKRWARNNLKNMFGWRTRKKLVVISVDDYGVVRVASRRAREKMEKQGLRIENRFDAYDALETTNDLEMLYDVLTSVKDKHGRYAVFSPFAVPCNINFEQVVAEGYARYVPELLTKTYEKLAANDIKAYGSAWSAWKLGISNGLLAPQFHGREHINLKVFEEKMQNKDVALMTALNNRSYSSIGNSGYPTISFTAAFEFDSFEETALMQDVVRTGLDSFEQVYGYRATQFNAPGGSEHRMLHRALKEGGVRYLDTPLIKREHQGHGKYRRMLNYTGKKNAHGQTLVVRNIVFEPAEDRGVDWVEFTFKQVEAAFRWGRPAVISSHRVNFCGHIDPDNRKIGLTALKNLLQRIASRWPDVEFIAAHELGNMIESSRPE